MKKNISTGIRIIGTAAVFAALAFISLNCIEKPLSPIMPTSTISLGSIPLVDVTKYYSDTQTKNSANLIINSDGTSSYLTSQTSSPQGIALPALDAQSQTLVDSVGTFTITPPPASFSIAATSISGLFTAGTLPILPADSFAMAAQPMGDTSTFVYVGISGLDNGFMQLNITNNLPVTVFFKQPIVLRNNVGSDSTQIASFRVDSLRSGETKPETSTVSLAGLKMWGLLTTDPVQISTPGSASSVTFDASSNLSLVLTTPSLVVKDARAKISSTPVLGVNDTSWVVDDSIVVSNATFSSGGFNVNFKNNTSVDVKFKVVFNELINTNNQPFSIDTTIPGNGTTSWTINMNQYHIAIAPAQIGTKLTYSAAIELLSSAVNKNISESDFIQVSVAPTSSFAIKSITGRITPTLTNINEHFASNINVQDINKFSGLIKFGGITLTAHLPLGGNAGCPADYHLAIILKNTKLHYADSIVIGTDKGNPPIGPGGTDIILNNVNISTLFPYGPDSIYVIGYVYFEPPNIFNGDTKTYSLYDTTKIYPSFNMNFPLAVGIASGAMTDTVGIGNNVIPKDYVKNVQHASLAFTFLNRMPFQISFRANFLGYDSIAHKRRSFLTIPQDTSKFLTIAADTVAASGFTNFGNVKSIDSVSLNNSDCLNLNKADSISLSMTIVTANGGNVVVKPMSTDYIRIVGSANLQYTIKPQ